MISIGVWYALYENCIKEKTFIYYSDGSSAYHRLVHHARVLFSTANGVQRKDGTVCGFVSFVWRFGSIISDTMTQNAANISWFVVYVTTQKVGRLLLWEQLFCTCIIWMSVYQLQLAATKCVKQMLSNTEQQVNLITHFSVKSVTLEQQSLMLNGSFRWRNLIEKGWFPMFVQTSPCSAFAYQLSWVKVRCINLIGEICSEKKCVLI